MTITATYCSWGNCFNEVTGGIGWCPYHAKVYDVQMMLIHKLTDENEAADGNAPKKTRRIAERLVESVYVKGQEALKHI